MKLVRQIGQIQIYKVSARFAYKVVVPSDAVVSVGHTLHRNFANEAGLAQGVQIVVNRSAHHLRKGFAQQAENLFCR